MVPWRMARITAVFVLVVMQAWAATAAAAAAQVEQVELYQEGGTTGVLLASDGELTYSLLSQQDPPRVLVQLPEAEMGPEALPSVTSKGLVRNLKLHRGDGKPPRLELILAGPAEASATREGTALRVALNPKTQKDSGRATPVGGKTGPERAGGERLQDYAVSRSDGETALRLKAGGPVERFQSFQLDEPNRLVVDLYGVDLGLPRSEYDLDHPFIDGVAFGQHGDRTRMVLRLREKITHSVEPSDTGLQVSLTRPSKRETLRRISDVDFTTGPDPEVGRITLEMDSTGAEAQVHREENRVVLDLPKTRLPQELEKRLVVTDFGTAVDTVDLYQKDETVRIVASGSDGGLQAQTYQVENRLVMDVSGSEKADPAKRGPQAAGEPYEGEKLSLNFQDIQVRQALQILAEFAELNIIATESVSGTLTLRLNDVPWDQALDLILDSQGLGMERQGNVIRVAPQAELRKQREEQLKAELQKEQLVPLQTEMVAVNYAKASQMKALLEAQGGGGGGSGSAQGSSGVLSQRGSVSVDQRTNTLIVRDTPEQIRKVKDLVDKLDRPTKQVMIEARIVKVDTNFGRNLGIRWGGQYSETTDHRFPNSVQASGSLSGAQAGQPDLAVDLPVGGAGGASPASVGMRLGHITNNVTLDLELQAIEAEGQGKIISSPRVVTANQQEASIKQGTEIPYQEATSSGATNISFEEAVLELGVTPQITPDNRLILDVNASNDSVGQQTAAGPAIDTEEVETQVVVDDGETVVIGGIFAKAERTDRTGVPVLRHIPLLGWLFQSKTTSTEKNELLIFLTPRIVKEDDLSEAAMSGES